MKKFKRLILVLHFALAISAIGGIGCDDGPADDPERDLAEQELEAEAKAQAQNRETREGLRDAGEQLQHEQEEKGEGVYGLTGGREAFERKQEEQRQAAREAKAKAAGFDSWIDYQQSLNGDSSTTRPD